jgi:hypothetical protein
MVHGRAVCGVFRREMGAIEVLEAEGWRGSARDTVKQTAELESAQRQARLQPVDALCMLLLCSQTDGTGRLWSHEMPSRIADVTWVRSNNACPMLQH